MKRLKVFRQNLNWLLSGVFCFSDWGNTWRRTLKAFDYCRFYACE